MLAFSIFSPHHILYVPVPSQEPVIYWMSVSYVTCNLVAVNINFTIFVTFEFQYILYFWPFTEFALCTGARIKVISIGIKIWEGGLVLNTIFNTKPVNLQVYFIPKIIPVNLPPAKCSKMEISLFSVFLGGRFCMMPFIAERKR